MKTFFKHSFLTLLLVITSTSFAQDSLKVRKFFNPDHIEVGAGLGIDAFGNSGLLLSIHPVIIVPIVERIHLGFNPNLSYFKDFASVNDDIRWGAGIFGRGFVTENFYAHLEFEELNTNRAGSINRAWRPSLMIGAGYRKKIDIINTYVTSMYIINYRSFSSPYSQPIVIRGGASVLLSEIKRKKKEEKAIQIE